MLDILERFELESADRGHGAFFPDNQPQLPTPRVFEGLGPSPIWRPAAALFRGVALALKTGGGHCGRFCLPACLPGDPLHTLTHGSQLEGFWSFTGKGQPCGMCPE